MADKKVTKDSISDKDPFGNIRKSAEETTPEIVALNKALEAIQQTAKATKKGAKIVDPKDVKSIDELNKLTERSNNLSKAKIQIDEALIKEKLKLQEANKQRNKDLKAEIALEDKQSGTLEKLAAKNTKLRQERQKLNLETKKGQQRLKEINTQLDKNNKIIEKNSDKLKQQKIGIGRYEKALGGLKNALGQLGIAFGAFALIRDSFSVVKDFEQSQADLASVLGVNVTEMSMLTAQAKELGATTTFTASQVSELQKELAKLGFTQEQIQDMTKSTLALAEATGSDLATAASVAGATLNGFGLDAKDTQRVVDVMAKSFSSSSLDMEKFKVAMAAVAPVAKNAGFSIEETTALIGTLTDRGIDASSAGTGLRNMFLDSNKAGLTFQEALDKINNSTDKTAASFDLFGKRGATLGVILAENQKTTATLTDTLKDADGAAEQMANTQRETLGGALALLRSAWEGFILSMNEAGGAGEKLRKVIEFLANNLSTILTTLGWVIKVLAVYKARLIAINVAQKLFNDGSGKMNISLKQMLTNLKKGSGGLKKFGGALKGIGFAVAITAAIELAKAYWDIVSGANAAKKAQELLNAANSVGAARASNFLSELRKNIKAQADLAKTEEQRLKITERANAAARVATANRIKLKREEAALLKAQKEAAEVALKKFEQDNVINAYTDFATMALLEAQRVAVANLAAEESERLTEIKALQGGLVEFSQAQDDATASINASVPSTKAATTAVKEQAEAVDDLTESLDELPSDIVDVDPEKFLTTEEEFSRMLLQMELDMRNAGATQEEIEADITAMTIEHLEIRIAERKRVGEDTLELEVELGRLQTENTEVVAKEKFEIDKQYIDLAESYFIASADRKIKKLDEEIAAHQRQADLLEQLAVNGNITAQESLAAENQAIAEANAQKEQEEKRKQQILAVSAFLQAYTSNLASGDDSATAFTKAATSQAVVDQFIGSLTGFHDGTEDTGNAGVFQDEHGVITGYTHKNERVITASDNAKMKGYSNAEVTRIVENHRLNDYTGGVQLGNSWEQQALVSQLMDVKQGLAEVNETIKNRPVSNMELGNIMASYMCFNQKVTTGNDSVTYKYKISK